MWYGGCTIGTRQTHKTRNLGVKAHTVVMVPKVLVPDKTWEHEVATASSCGGDSTKGSCARHEPTKL